MYEVSAAYDPAIASPQRVTSITGTITLASGRTIDIADEDIVQGSLYLSSQCVSGDDIDVGSVYAPELGFALKTDLENPYSLQGARVDLKFGVAVSGGIEQVPLGLFYADMPTRQAGKVTLKCYDGMLLFDKPIDDMPAPKSPHLLLLDACKAANVILANRQADIEALPNGTLTLTPPTGDSAVKTWRDLLMWICQALGGWAAMTREGELEIRSYGTVSKRTIDAGIRMRATASDTQVHITKVTMKLGDVTYSQNSQGAEEMTMVLEGNPLFGKLEAAQVDAALAALLARLGTVQYVPATVEFNGDPALDPGDLVTLPDTAAGELIVPIMKSTWRYRGRHDIATVGKSARLRAEYSQNSKALSAVAVEAAAATQSVQLINKAIGADALGGHVLIRQSPRTGETNEILIMDNPDPTQARKIWRWNVDGLGYSDNCIGADNPDRERLEDGYKVAITMDGGIRAEFVKAGVMKGEVIFAGKLEAANGDIDKLIAGDAAGARMELGVNVDNEPVIHVFTGNDPVDNHGKPVPMRSIKKDGDYFDHQHVIQRTYALGTRTGTGVFIA